MIHPHHKNGFTLIELSIVLVIISLIVGGVIGGKSLIRASELQAIITDVKKYETAYNTFKLQYDAFPGDFTEAEDYWGAAVTDNGNGNKTYATGGWYMPETLLAWQHLALADIYPNSLTAAYGSSPNQVQAGVNVPKSPLGIGWITLGSNPSGINAIVFGGNTSPYLDSAFSSGKVSKFIDKKLDDGMPHTGRLKVRNFGNCRSGNGTDATYILTGEDSDMQCALYYTLE